MNISFDNIPEELKNASQWVCWKYVPNAANPDKPRKLPIDPKTGKAASSTDPATWGDFEHAEDCLKRGGRGGVNGIGFVFTKDDSYTGIDLDKCRNPETGEIQSWAQEIIRDFSSYTELSPSETGVHIIVKGGLSGTGKKVGDVEMYDKGRYFTFTGNHLAEFPSVIELRQPEINHLYAGLSKQQNKKDKQTLPNNFGDLTDNDVIHMLSQGKNGEKFSTLMAGDSSAYPSHSEADLALCSMLSKAIDSAKTIDRIC